MTVPREKGDDRNLTQTPGAHERSPAWSPDGQLDRVLLGRGRRVRVARRRAGRPGPAAADRALRRRLLRQPALVAGREEAELHRQLALAVGARRRHRQGHEGLVRGRLRAGARAAPRLVAGLEVARVHAQHADLLQPAVPVLGIRRPLVPGERRPRRRDEPGLRRVRQVPVLPRLDRRRAGERLVLAGERRHAHGAAGLPRGARQGRRLAAREGERRGEARRRGRRSASEGEGGDGARAKAARPRRPPARRTPRRRSRWS